MYVAHQEISGALLYLSTNIDYSLVLIMANKPRERENVLFMAKTEKIFEKPQASMVDEYHSISMPMHKETR